MFVDEATIVVIGGDGGNGCLSFRREKFVARGGPNGGDGGKGGSVILQADPSVSTLLAFRYQPQHRGPRGRHGEGSNKTGRSGEDRIVKVPVGTVVLDEDGVRCLADLDEADATFVAASGGRGGRGNARFATSTNRAPTRHDPGSPGEERSLRLELKLLADVGLVGLPNAGKSTLISRISAAHPKIADYPFTTLEPHLGVVDRGDHRSFVVADIPGLIEGAHEGAGLGLRFLRHIERCSLVLHLVDPTGSMGDPVAALDTIDAELSQYGTALADKPQIVVVTKADATQDSSVVERLRDRAEQLGRPCVIISSVAGTGIKELIRATGDALDRLRSATAHPVATDEDRPATGHDETVVGVLGGTFDPVHDGHLAIARRVLERTGLTRVLILPSGVPPHKQSRLVSPARHREAMLRLAVEGEPGLEICTAEIDSGEVGYTIDTMRRLRDGTPPVVPVFIMGMDSLVELPTWKEFRSLIREFDLIAVDRPDSDDPARPLDREVAGAIAELPDEAEPRWRGGRIYRLRIPPIPISSSGIRAAVARGDGMSGLVPPAVARYIHANSLYLEEERR